MQLKSGIEWQIISDMQNQWKLMKLAFAKHLPVELLHMPRNTTPFYFVKKLSLCGNWRSDHLSGFFKCQWSNFNCHQEMDLWPKDVGSCLEYCVFSDPKLISQLQKGVAPIKTNTSRPLGRGLPTPREDCVQSALVGTHEPPQPPRHQPQATCSGIFRTNSISMTDFCHHNTPEKSWLGIELVPIWWQTIDDPGKLIQYCGINPLRLH